MLDKIANRKKQLLSIGIFLVIFGALVVIASFFDYRISEILVGDGLEGGRYISNNAYGLFFEALGSCPMYLMASVACCVLFWHGYRRISKDGLKIVCCIVFAVGAFAGVFLTVKDVFSYIGNYVMQETGVLNVLNNMYVYALAAVMSMPTAIFGLLLWGRIKPETNEKLVPWVLVILGTMAFYLIVHFTKSPQGRARFRAIQAYAYDPSYYDNALSTELGKDVTSVINGETFSFRNWWVQYGSLTDKFEAIGIDEGYKSALEATGLASDVCKSFPSGHTFSAGLTYTLICLPDLVERFKTKGWRIFWYALPVFFTGLVAVSRIVMGAHYMSDVLFGGTCAFVGVIVMRWLVLCGGYKKIAALFGKKKAEAVTAESGSDDNAPADNNAEVIEENTDSLTDSKNEVNEIAVDTDESKALSEDSAAPTDN